MSWGQDPNDGDDPSTGRGADRPLPPPPDQSLRRDPSQRRNPQLGRDPQWGRDPDPDSLRPLNLGDVLDGMFRIARIHWKAFTIGLSVIVVPLSVLSGLVLAQMFGTGPGLLGTLQNPELLEAGQPTPSPQELVRIAITGALTGLASLLLTPLVYGVAVRIAATGHRAGDVDPIDSVKAAAKRYPALLGSTFLASLVVGAIAVVPLVLVGLGTASENTALTLIGGIAVLAGIVCAVIAAIRLSLVVPAVIVEQAGAVRALRRSNELVKGRTGMVFGTLLVVYIIVAIIGFVLTLPFQAGVLQGGQMGAVITTIGSIVSSLVTNSLLGAAFVLVYFDRRVRAEGYDLSELAAELGDDDNPPW
ncbi:MAG TPA: hypothetical protein VK923_08740 [Euzebyales bacterium]|nr:hypothetical protein [Euzebyales bacterium]